ncbi:sphinganine C4-monooxygenase 1-like [Durio zibethinus]|uniref:Sphinganine C4-monooxygenase 1-like n=1 Tax=Durio zibethinus TaxID=66656 RepID=A0A6P6BFM2_DURZI|nr:sphinganine C4-monooxygenase 1-like [Durio zibethinus]
MALKMSDELLGIVMPILVYWIYSGIYMALESTKSFDNYKLHSKEDEDDNNLVSKTTVIKGVLLTQTLQAVGAFLLFTVTRGNEAETSPREPSSLIIIATQFVIAMLVFDTWTYFTPRYMHQNKFLYRHLHSWHHQLVVSYAFGVQYTHPLEGLLVDTVGGALAFIVSGMSPRTSIFFFLFVSLKIVDDHCGLRLPGNLIQIFFKNNSAYHDVHHQLYGGKYNFSQPSFIMGDRILGTYMPYSLEKRAEGAFEVRAAAGIKEYNKDG